MKIGKKIDLTGALTITNPIFTLIITVLSFMVTQSISSRSNLAR
jgi:hypothetical protein